MLNNGIEDLYHRCRWCRHFNNGKCTIADEVFEIPNIAQKIEYVIDDGGLAEAIRETIDSHLQELLYASDSTEKTITVVDKIIEEIEIAVKNLSFGSNDLEVKDPSTNDHYCKRFE